MNLVFDVIVVGAGIAGCLTAFEIKKKYPNKKCLVVGSEQFAPACSFRTTSIVSAFGAKIGTEMGDRILMAFQAFLDFVQSYNPNGVQKCQHFYLEHDREILSRKFSNKSIGPIDCILGQKLEKKMYAFKDYSFQISPEIFLPWLKENLQNKGVFFEDDFIHSITSNKKVYGLTGMKNAQLYNAKIIVLCTGAYTKINSVLYPQRDLIEKTKIVKGGYLVKKNISLPSSFILSHNAHHIIYRALDQTLLIGSSSVEGDNFLFDLGQIEKIYTRLTKLFKDRLFLPRIDSFEKKCGIRHKGIQRKYICDILEMKSSEIKILGNFGHYKNGFTFPFISAKKIAKMI